jgi:hypothetical protein
MDIGLRHIAHLPAGGGEQAVDFLSCLELGSHFYAL